jgi:hypothetical protein
MCQEMVRAAPLFFFKVESKFEKRRELSTVPASPYSPALSSKVKKKKNPISIAASGKKIVNKKLMRTTIIWR